MRLSAVIPAYNAGETLPRVLEALLPQLEAGDECVVVDDASTDGTAAVASRYPVRLIRRAQAGGPAGARNLGAAEASGDVLVFLDSDVAAHPDVLARFRAHFADPSIEAVMGSYDDAPLAPGTVSRFRNLLHCYTHQTGNREASTFWAGCGAIRRESFERHNGFDAGRYPTPSIEDIELGLRVREAGGRIVLDPAIQGKHCKKWGIYSMLHTDLWRRAVPWSELILASGKMPEDLNVKASQRVSTVFAALGMASLPATFAWPAESAMALLGTLAMVGALNQGFYQFLAMRGGWMFALRCVPVHWLYFLCAGSGFAIAAGRHWLRRDAQGKR